jgi:hypothetical protein
MGAMRVRVVDPSSSVRYEATFEPLHALLALAIACLAILAINLLFSPSRAKARLALHDKAMLLVLGSAHMALSADKQFKISKQPDPDVLLTSTTQPMRTKRIILVRHGESLWNSVFNKAPMILMPIRLARALFYEALVLLELDSVLFDSPLSAVGRAQARDLADFLARAHRSPETTLERESQRADVRALFGETSSVVVSSMLRRAVSTGASSR